MRRLISALVVVLVWCAAASAQTAPGFVLGSQPTAAQWNGYFGGKADTVNGLLTSPTINGGTLNNLSSLTATGNTTIGGTLGVTGAATLNGGALFNYTPPGGAAVNYGEVNANGTFNWPLGAAGGCCRLHYWSDNVTVNGNQAGINVLEANFFNLIISGTGTLTNEAFNIVHPYVYIPAGVTISGYGENFEASASNDGNISGALYGNLDIFTNNNGTTGSYVSFTTGATNKNTAVGSFVNYTGFQCAGFNGPGSAPTYNWCLVNRDSTASIVSSGGVVIGTLANAVAPGTLYIQGPDTSGSTYPLSIKNSTLSNLFYITDAGDATLGSGNFNISSGSLSVTGSDNSGATYPLSIRNLSGTILFDISNAGSADLNVGDLNATAGAVSAALGYKVGASIGQTCSGSPTASFATVGGIVTHC